MKLWIFAVGTFLLVYNQPGSTAYEKVTRLAAPFPEKTEVSIGIIDHGKRLYVGFIKTKGRLVLKENQQKVFGIASITKLFTCALIADLAVKNKIALDDDIDKYYPFDIHYSGDAKKVTITGLCTHTSGLPVDGIGVEPYLKKTVRVDYSEGKYRYSNLGFMILGDIIEKVSKKDYGRLLTERILQPLHMKNTAVQASFKYAGVGSIRSNAVDMLNFLDHQFFRSSALKAGFRLMQKTYFVKSKTESMGLGWHILQSNGGSVYYHQGFLNGYTAEIRYAANKKRGVVVLSNLSAKGPYAGRIEKIAVACLEE